MRRKEKKVLVLHKINQPDLIDENILVIGGRSKVKSVAKKIQDYRKKHDGIVPSVYVVDPNKKLLGEIPLVKLIHASDEKLVTDLTHRAHSVHDHVKPDELIRIATKARSDRIAVIDEHDTPIGVIHTRDLLALATRQGQGRALGVFAGTHRDERANDGPLTAVHLRYKWLILNLATALLAVFTVSIFEATLSQMVILAAYMPLVAGMGGNAGSQAVAVTVRGIAIGEVKKGTAWRIILKEVIAGLINGIIVGALVAGMAMFIGQSMLLGLVLGLALIINLVVAGLFGAGVPLMLNAMKLDPALSASVFVTTATDVLGFLAFLGLAGVILL